MKLEIARAIRSQQASEHAQKTYGMPVETTPIANNKAGSHIGGEPMSRLPMLMGSKLGICTGNISGWLQ